VKQILLDTCVWSWSLTDSPRLSRRARDAIADADAIYVSPVSFFEVAQKVRVGKWPEMERYVDKLSALLADQGMLIAALTPEIGVTAGILDWSHRDPFDRLIAVTSITTTCPLVSADSRFDELDGRCDWRSRVW